MWGECLVVLECSKVSSNFNEGHSGEGRETNTHITVFPKILMGF
jgi:hypothetical protein